jgi:hypothetical protein
MGGSVARASVEKRRSSSSIAARFTAGVVGNKARKIEASALLATVGQWCARRAGRGASVSPFSSPAKLRHLGIPGTTAWYRATPA